MRHWLAIALMAGAMACFAGMDASTKILAVAGVPVLLVVWARNVFQLAVVSATLLPRRGRALVRTRRPALQCLRAMLLLGTSITGFFGIRAMPLAAFTSIVLLTPLALTVVTVITGDERVGPWRWACVAAGLAGAVFVLRPGGHADGSIALLGIAIVIVNTAYQWVTSRLARKEDAGTTQFYTGAVGTVVTSIGLPFAWHALPGANWTLLLLVCALGMAGHQFLIVAYRSAPVSQLAPFLYLQLAFATIAGWLVFSHAPDFWTFVGLALIAASGVVSTRTGAKTAATVPASRPGIDEPAPTPPAATPVAPAAHARPG